MSKHLMIVYSNAKPGRDAEYMDWYKNVHIGEICQIPAVKNGHMYEAIPASPSKPSTTYVAAYELETEDPMAVLAEIGRRGQAGEFNMSDAVDSGSAQFMFLKQNF
jgi:hypothetical protein